MTSTERGLALMWFAVFAFSTVTLFQGGSMLFLGIGVVALVWDLLEVRELMILGQSDMLLKHDRNEIRSRLGGMAVPTVLNNSGYEIDVQHLALRSSKVDDWVRSGHTWEISAPTTRRHGVDRCLLDNRGFLRRVLRAQVRMAIDGNKEFFDDRKVCLGSDLEPAPGQVDLYLGSYFTSYLTNDASCHYIRDRRTLEPIDGFPLLYPTDVEGAGLVLNTLDQSGLGNHLGASVLALTADDKLLVWRQSHRAAQSPGRAVPTGSGSADLIDFENAPDLISAVRRNMQRELGEESDPTRWIIRRRIGRLTALGDPDLPLVDVERIWVTGYFRDLYRGGKPDFVGACRIGKRSDELAPSLRELYPEPLRRDVPDRAALHKECERLLAEPGNSVSLAVCLLALSEAIESHPDQADHYLFPT